MPRIIVDITRHEVIVDEPMRRTIFHSYPDRLPEEAKILSYSMEELLAEKTRALRERTRPRDLYDVVYLGQNMAPSLNAGSAREIFDQKCKAKNIRPPTPTELIAIASADAELASEWGNMLGHQLPSLPDLPDYIGRLADATRWLLPLAAVPPPAPFISAEGAAVATTPSIEYYGQGSPLENLRFAGANRLLVEFVYNGKSRLVEPYSLRMSGQDNLLLYAWEVGGTNIKAFTVTNIRNLRITDRPFTPRYQIELAPGRFATIPVVTTHYRAPSAARYRRKNSSGPTYVFECTYCGKRFRRSKYNSSLKSHKIKNGYSDCSGRSGSLVDTIF